MRTSSEPARASALTCARWQRRPRCRCWSSTARRSGAPPPMRDVGDAHLRVLRRVMSVRSHGAHSSVNRATFCFDVRREVERRVVARHRDVAGVADDEVERRRPATDWLARRRSSVVDSTIVPSASRTSTQDVPRNTNDERRLVPRRDRLRDGRRHRASRRRPAPSRGDGAGAGVAGATAVSGAGVARGAPAAARSSPASPARVIRQRAGAGARAAGGSTLRRRPRRPRWPRAPSGMASAADSTAWPPLRAGSSPSRACVDDSVGGRSDGAPRLPGGAPAAPRRRAAAAARSCARCRARKCGRAVREVVRLERLDLPRRELQLLRDVVERQPALARAAREHRAGRRDAAPARRLSAAGRRRSLIRTRRPRERLRFGRIRDSGAQLRARTTPRRRVAEPCARCTCRATALPAAAWTCCMTASSACAPPRSALRDSEIAARL